ncbi:MAG TPA: hypothetical protein PKZ84_11565 [Anaerolineae bacterium]|nr:hypothetical protein [Anaerolineae bacterium]
MSESDEINVQLEHISALYQRAAQLAQELTQQQIKRQRFQNLMKEWEAQPIWEEGRRLSWEELQLYKAQLEDTARRNIRTKHALVNPEQEIQALDTSLQKAQARLTQLHSVIEQIDHLEQLLQRWQEIKATQPLLAQLTLTLDELSELQDIDPHLITAYQELQALREKVQAQHHLRQDVEALARELAGFLPNGDAESWAALATTDSESLVIAIGTGEKKLREELDVFQEALVDVNERLEQREAAVTPIRERVEQLEAQLKAYQEKTQDNVALLREWGKAALPDIDQRSEEALQTLLTQLQVEFQHLNWFDAAVQEQRENANTTPHVYK